MKGEWILKEVYFEDGWPSVIRDPVRPVQEPVAWEQLHEHMAGPFYKAPRPWVGLDDDEYQTILGQLGDGGLLAFYNLIESKLKEKNNG